MNGFARRAEIVATLGLGLGEHRKNVCVPWSLGKNKDGYGTFKRSSKTLLAHRELCILAHGPPPSSLHHAAHSCDNRLCISRHHIRWASLQQNIQDRQDRQRQQRGSRHYLAKLAEPQIPLIRARLSRGETAASVAKDVGVTPATINMVRRRETWMHVA